MKQKTFYYSDELRDDFGECVKSRHPLPKNYVYASKNPFFKMFSFFIYRIIVRPIAWLYVKMRFCQRFVGKKAIKGVKGGYFLFGNHTTFVGDAFVPNLLTVRRRNYIITGEAAASLTAILPLMKALGNIPMSSDRVRQVELLRCVKKRIRERSGVTVYPEAHIWPYYTGIRPFVADSFLFPVLCNAPAFAMTTCFQRKRLGRSPRIVTCIDGPFYPDETLPREARVQALRDEVYAAMCRRAAEYSTYSYHNYVRKDDTE